MSWESVIGLEVHVQLKTETKMFCRCANGFGEPQNTQTCPVCLAHPGTLPVPNRTAVEWTVKLGLALGCAIAPRAIFHRKNYFYPDNPKGYQISQYDEPLCVDGLVVVPGEDGEHEVGIVRAHLEEDAAKTVHRGGAGGRIVGAERSLIDFNRGGTPLVEIVTRPDIRSAGHARRFLQLLRQTIVELGISDAEMEKGTLRCDANVSVREVGEEGFRTRWELKNMNSFTFIGRGIDAAVREQVAIHEADGEVVQETYDYDADRDTLTPHRTKEEADDYRYFPEPDLVPIEPERELVDRLRGELPEPPGARIRRLEKAVGFERALDVVMNGWVGDFDGITTAGAVESTTANFLMNELTASGVKPGQITKYGEVAKLIEARDRIPRDVYLDAVSSSGAPDFSAEAYLSESRISDTTELEPLIERILAANESQVATYRSGKEGVLGFFVGQVMKETGGKADPKVVNEVLLEKLKA